MNPVSCSTDVSAMARLQIPRAGAKAMVHLRNKAPGNASSRAQRARSGSHREGQGTLSTRRPSKYTEQVDRGREWRREKAQATSALTQPREARTEGFSPANGLASTAASPRDRRGE